MHPKEGKFLYEQLKESLILFTWFFTYEIPSPPISMRYMLLQLALLIAFLTEIRLDFSSLVLLKATTGNVSIMSLLHGKLKMLISWSTVELEIVRSITVKNSCWLTYPADENYSVSCTHGIATHIYADILSNICVATLHPPQDKFFEYEEKNVLVQSTWDRK